MSKKLILHAALASMVLGCAPISAADGRVSSFIKNNPVLVKSIATPSVIFLAASALALKHNHPKENFEQKGEWKGILKLNQAWGKQTRKEYFQNISNVFWTRWVGQEHKSGYLELDKATGAIKPTKKCLPYGVMGTTSGYLYEAEKAGSMILTLGLAYKFITDPKGTLTWIMNPFSMQAATDGDGSGDDDDDSGEGEQS